MEKLFQLDRFLLLLSGNTYNQETKSSNLKKIFPNTDGAGLAKTNTRARNGNSSKLHFFQETEDFKNVMENQVDSMS